VWCAAWRHRGIVAGDFLIALSCGIDDNDNDNDDDDDNNNNNNNNFYFLLVGVWYV